LASPGINNPADPALTQPLVNVKKGFSFGLGGRASMLATTQAREKRKTTEQA